MTATRTTAATATAITTTTTTISLLAARGGNLVPHFRGYRRLHALVRRRLHRQAVNVGHQLAGLSRKLCPRHNYSGKSHRVEGAYRDAFVGLVMAADPA